MSDLPRECPACGGPLRPWPPGGVTVDGCDQCGGVWFDGHELQAVAQRGESAL
ncbi:MAG: zf-TFIIB domain-containing protein [Armatimonadetes bacterium]|nr:zf-TFIIB domain-containing protein [Armatimonadota bacterium]